MKTPSVPSTSTTEAGKQLLARFAAVDELLLRPSADQTAAAFLEETEKKPAPRIGLVRKQELEQFIRNHPADSEPYRELAQIYLNEARFKDALRVLDQGIDHNPENEPLLLMREESMLANAHQVLVEARKFADFNTTETAKRELEICEIDLANLRAKVCERRYQRHPEQSELLIPWAIALRQLGRLEESIECLSKAAAEPSLRARACLQLGMAYHHAGNVLAALSAYRRAALFRAPTAPPEIKRRALELAIELASQHELIDSARRFTELLLEEKPDNAESLKRKLVRLRNKSL